MNKPAFEGVGIDKCAGCFACYNSCNLNAIHMTLNDEGFFMPKIDYNSCNNCGLCSNKCPVIKESKKQNILMKAFAAWNVDDNIRLNSSSGGIFSAIAKYVIESLNGVVYGATFEHGIVKHVRIDSVNDLNILRKSKYLQSYIGLAYKDVIQDLKNNKYVLFVGTPCQIEALNKLVVNNEKLITCDLVCHGVPSYLAFDSYIQSIGMNIKNIDVDFRNKDNGWKNFKVILKDNVNNKVINTHHIDNKFFKGFVDNRYLKKSCYNCKFSKMPRVGDITLGDFWGVNEKYYNDLGVSIVLTNNEKGLEVINTLVSREEIVAQNINEDEFGDNKRIYNGVYDIPEGRDEMAEIINNKGFNIFYKRYIHVTFYKRVINKLKRIFQV